MQSRTQSPLADREPRARQLRRHAGQVEVQRRRQESDGDDHHVVGGAVPVHELTEDLVRERRQCDRPPRGERGGGGGGGARGRGGGGGGGSRSRPSSSVAPRRSTRPSV